MHGKEGKQGSPARELTCGFFAGAANVVSGYPFDTVKVRLQASNGVYSGMLDCFRHIWQEEGVRGLYRGVSAPLVGGAAETAVNYLVYSRVLQALEGPCRQLPHMQAVPVAGAVAGVALSSILAPTELIKCRMQMSQQQSIAACVRSLLHEEGPRGLTRGLGATLTREIPGNALFFTVYEGLRRTLPGRPATSAGHEQGHWVAVAKDAALAVFCGGMAGVVMWATVLPLDVAKTRIQTAHPGEPWDTNVLTHLRMLWREGGRRALWSGFTPTIARAFPANACQWLAWELAMRQLAPRDTEEAKAPAAGTATAMQARTHQQHQAAVGGL